MQKNKTATPVKPSVEIIAEIGSNHNRDLGLISKMVTAAANAGAHAAKFQTFRAETLYSKNTPVAAYLKDTDFVRGKSTTEFIRELELPREWYPEVRKMVLGAGLEFLSTPFGLEELEFLIAQGIRRIKIGSSELTNYPLLEAAGAAKLPVILSTGMSNLGDIEKALAAVRRGGSAEVILLHCLVAYPSLPEEYNLKAILTLKQAFGLAVGISDHTLGTLIPVLSVALGASMIEKHVTLDRGLPGPDHKHAMTMPEFAAMCAEVRLAEQALGDGIKRVMPSEVPLYNYRSGLIVKRLVREGHEIAREDLEVKRPCFGIHPEFMEIVVGRKARATLEPDAILTWDMV
ncbi:MAG: N-acetylneuraminate synthase family protein [Sulfuritalea sp.]|nr:N-acetylneuraminate synthase family protein [Sulfuritalea sp.]